MDTFRRMRGRRGEDENENEKLPRSRFGLVWIAANDWHPCQVRSNFRPRANTGPAETADADSGWQGLREPRLAESFPTQCSPRRAAVTGRRV